ncbi:MAG: hypothetical protein V1907_02880 [Candidatus Kerfeldbacteria bacterium]
MKFIDTHAHLCFKAFEKDWIEYLGETTYGFLVRCHSFLLLCQSLRLS